MFPPKVQVRPCRRTGLNHHSLERSHTHTYSHTLDWHTSTHSHTYTHPFTHTHTHSHTRRGGAGCIDHICHSFFYADCKKSYSTHTHTNINRDTHSHSLEITGMSLKSHLYSSSEFSRGEKVGKKRIKREREKETEGDRAPYHRHQGLYAFREFDKPWFFKVEI